MIAAVSMSGGAGFWGGPGLAQAKAGDKKAAAAPAHEVNACGCYRDTAGACFCGKKGKCACPGDCEPKGCEAKREKEIQKEVAAETKKAAAADKKQRQAAHDASKRAKHETDGTGQ
ncbi:MAG TPA: hypothetical protein VLA14_08155 [Polyangia bacterium]|nr:hypothetical protein [Polyangia bacterium]